jgi:hypothetical protein
MTSEYSISRFPIQDDQSNAYPWVAGESPGGFWNEVDALIDDTLDGFVGGIGDWNGSMFLGVASPLMIQHLESEIWQTDGKNEPVTIVDYSVTRGWFCLQCIGRLKIVTPSAVAQAQPASGYVRRLQIDFDTGTLIAVDGGSDFSNDFNDDFGTEGIPE